METARHLWWSFTAKMFHHRYLTGCLTSLWLCLQSLFILGIILNFEFHILAGTMITGTKRRIQDPIKHLWWYFLRNLSKVEKTVPKFFKTFFQIYLRFIIYYLSVFTVAPSFIIKFFMFFNSFFCLNFSCSRCVTTF